MINFSELSTALRNEKSSSTIMHLHEDFYCDGHKLFESPDAKQYKENILQIMEEIYILRVNKLIHYAGREWEGGEPPKNSIECERKIFRELQNILTESRKTIFKSCEPKKPKPQPIQTVNCRFLTAMPQIIGSDSLEYGPFRLDDVLKLPKDTAKMLVERGVAEYVE